MGNPSKSFEFIRLYPKLSADPVSGKLGEMYFNTLNNSLRLCISESPLTWKSLGGSGSVLVDLYDPVATVLPSGPSATVDGIALVDDMEVLFSSLTVGNNRIYKVSGVGVSMVWTPVADFSTGLDPVVNDKVSVISGTGFGLQEGTFDGTTFLFNDVTRFFSGSDYWELSSLKTLNFPDNATTNAFSVSITGSENMVIDYSIARGTAKETGTVHVTSDGSAVSFATSGAYLLTSGVSFSFNIALGILYFDIISDSSGSAGSIKYFVRRWSNLPGGPGGIPNYSTGPSSPSVAAGTNGDVQFNSSNLLGADASFKWDSVNKDLNLNGFKIGALSSPIVLTDNTVNGIAFTYPKTYRFVVITFGIWRNGAYRVGRMLIVNDDTTANYQDDSIVMTDPGVTLSAAVVGSDIEVRYTTTLTGIAANMRCSVTKFGE
jgi:hypothetical protein